MDFFAEKAKGLAGDIKDRLEAELVEKKAMLMAQAEAFKNEKLEMLKQFEEEKKAMLVKGFVGKFNNVFEYFTAVLLTLLKEVSDDPYMPRWFKGWVDAILDALWPDVKEEVRTALLAEILKDDPLAHGEPNCTCSPLAFFRYNLYPYDRNVWRLIRNPIWWICAIISLVPVYSIAQCYYFILFFIVDKQDQFQLEQFITSFKSLQFMSLGVVSAIVGSIQYYVCTTRDPPDCPDVAPRVEVYTALVFVGQVLLIWVAFLLVYWARKKGGIYYQQTHNGTQTLHSRADREQSLFAALRGETLQAATAENQVDDEERERIARARLINFLIYDFITFLICAALVVWATWFNEMDKKARVTENDDGAGNGNWKYAATLYWIKALYGLLSFPFVLLRIPGLSALFSHARPTGYNPYGNTVPYLGKEEDGPVPWDPHRPFTDPDRQEAYEAARLREPTRVV